MRQMILFLVAALLLVAASQAAVANPLREYPEEFCAKKPAYCWREDNWLGTGVRLHADLRLQFADGGGQEWNALSAELSQRAFVGVQFSIFEGTLTLNFSVLPPFDFKPSGGTRWLLARDREKVSVRYGLTAGLSWRGAVELGVGNLLFDRSSFEPSRGDDRVGIGFWYLGVQPLMVLRQLSEDFP